VIFYVNLFLKNKQLIKNIFKSIKNYTKKNSKILDGKILKKKIDPENIIFGYIGAIVPNKGIIYLLNQLQKLESNKYLIIIAGRGEDSFLTQVNSSIKKDKINAQLVGYMNPKEFFSKINILIVPSLWNDTLPTVITESLSIGVPVIGSNRGGIPELIKDKINGYIINPDDDSLSILLRKIIVNPKHMIGRLNANRNTLIQKNVWLKNYELVFGSAMENWKAFH